nr:hypothetical protein [Microbacterium sp. NIBRBAC000506063]
MSLRSPSSSTSPEPGRYEIAASDDMEELGRAFGRCCARVTCSY